MPNDTAAQILEPPASAVAPVLSSTTPSKKKRKADSVSKDGNSPVKETPSKKAKGKQKDTTPKEKKQPGPVVLLAKVPLWKDIPEWGDKTLCPLLKIPGEVLDKIFNPDQNFHSRDWIALAGVNKMFRQRLDHSIFEEIWHENEEENRHAHPFPTGQPVWHIFTRNIARAPAEIFPLTHPVKLPFHPPRGPRESWTRAQYASYKEARRHYTIIEKKKRADRAEKAALKAVADAARVVQPTRRIQVGRAMRTVYTMVPGQKDGDPAVKKGARGMPVGVATNSEEEKKEKIAKIKAKAKAAKEEAEATRIKLSGDKAPEWVKSDGEWEVPETDGEDDLDPEVELKEDGGARNESRIALAAQVNDQWINQTNAIKEYDVTRAQLLGLRHALIPNPRNSNQPQQMFLKAAVGALALRAHGGMAGHWVHAEKKAQLSQMRATNKKAKIAKDIAEGKPVPVKKPQRPFPTALEYKARRDMANFDYGYDEYGSDHDDFGKGGCDECMDLWVHADGPPGGRCKHGGGPSARIEESDEEDYGDVFDEAVPNGWEGDL